jgi:hypothetical protein
MKSYQPTTLFTLLLSFTLLFSCKPAVTEGVEETKKDTSTSLPALGNTELTELYAAAERADIIFYNLPISVDQDDATSAKNSVLYVSPTSQEMNPACKPLGRITWMTNGSIFKEADIYIDQGCQYFVFIKNNQPMAVNAMSQSGVLFFQNVIEQVKKRSQ